MKIDVLFDVNKERLPFSSLNIGLIREAGAIISRPKKGS